LSTVLSEGRGRIFLYDDVVSNAWQFIRAVVSGALITIAMTGLDQDKMQKNLACRTLRQSQHNMILFSLLLIVVNFMFLSLGAFLYYSAVANGIALPAETDFVFPTMAFEHLAAGGGVVFVLGLIAATFSGADASLTALTTTTCVDFLGMNERPEALGQRRLRMIVHLIYAGLTLFVVLWLHRATAGQTKIQALLSLVGLMYGPLLGIFAFGLMTRRRLREPLVPLICIASPAIAYWLERREYYCGLRVGDLLILVNAAITWLGLLLISVTYTTDDPSNNA
jgi:Na+/proline symporter